MFKSAWFHLAILCLLVVGIVLTPPLVKPAPRDQVYPMPLHPELLRQWRQEGRTLPPPLDDPAFFARQGFNRPFRRPTPLRGPINALAVVIEFSDNVHTVTATYFDHLIFDPPVTGRGSVRDYFEEVSYSQVDIVTVDVPSSLGWIMAPQTCSYYADGQACFGSYPRNCQKLAEDIVDAVDALVDFSLYDNDGTGYMDPIMLVHAGQGYERTGDPNDIWSHSGSLVYPRYYDGVWIEDYVIMPEYWETVSSGDSDMTIGVFCHEMGHGFWGLPDLYDYDGSSFGVGDWSLMAGGAWNGPNSGGWGSDGSSPAWMDAWSRVYAGLDTSYNLEEPAVVTFSPAAGQPGEILRLQSATLQPLEYFLLENRQRLPGTYDEYLPAGGLLIWHVDDSLIGYGPNSNECRYIPHCSGQCVWTHYLVALEQADGYDHLEWHANRGDPADPFPGSSNRTAWQPYLTNPVNPESGSWFDSNCQQDSCIDLTDIACAPQADCTAYVRRADCTTEADLGDAPASANHAGLEMTAYRSVGPLPTISAGFPTVYLPLRTDPGPRHRAGQADCWLGAAVSGEWNADLPPDDDGVGNIAPLDDQANLDGADDGLAWPLLLAPCQETTLAYTLTVASSAPFAPRYVNVWLDGNRDGDWADTFVCPSGASAPEWAVRDQSWLLGAGVYHPTATLQTPVFIVAENAPLEAWLRLSVAEGPAPAPQDGRGPAAGYEFGETEDYLLTISPSLELSSSLLLPPLSGDLLTLTLRYGGHGNVVAADVVLSDVLPLEVDYVSSVPPGTYDPAAHTITWTVDLVPSWPAAVTLTVQVTDRVTPCHRITDTAALLWSGSAWRRAAWSFGAGCPSGDPQAAFTYTLPVCTGSPITFTNLSTGTLPLAYSWDLDGDGTPDSTATDPTWHYTASSHYIVTLTATNVLSSSTYSAVVTVVQGLGDLDIDGPVSLIIGQVVTYTAIPSPPDATDPVYAWSNGLTGITATYSWTIPGLYVVTVTGSNDCGRVTATLDVLVSSECVSLTEVTISGPPSLQVGEEGTYLVTPWPPTATNPAYLWDNGSTTVHTTYSWPLAGGYTVTVTATNCLSVVVSDRMIVDVRGQFLIYLPLVHKGSGAQQIRR